MKIHWVYETTKRVQVHVQLISFKINKVSCNERTPSNEEGITSLIFHPINYSLPLELYRRYYYHPAPCANLSALLRNYIVPTTFLLIFLHQAQGKGY